NSVDSTGENIGENTSENIREKNSENVPKKIENEILFILKMSTVDKIKFTLSNFSQNFFIKKAESKINKTKTEIGAEQTALEELKDKLELEKKQYTDALAGITDPEIIAAFEKNRDSTVLKIKHEISTKDSIISDLKKRISNEESGLFAKKEKITELRQDFSAKVDQMIELVKKNTKYEQIKELVSKNEIEIEKTNQLVTESNKIVEQIERALENRKMLRWMDVLRLKSRLKESKKNLSRQKDEIYFLDIDIKNLKKEQVLTEEAIKKWESLKITDTVETDVIETSAVENENVETAEEVAKTPDTRAPETAETNTVASEKSEEADKKTEHIPSGSFADVEASHDSKERTKKMILEMVLSVFEKQRKEKEILNNVLEKIKEIRSEKNPDKWRTKVKNLSETGILDDLDSLNQNQSSDSAIASTIILFEEILKKAENISKYNKVEFDDDFDNLTKNIESCINPTEI
ncbi:MAG TPA: hypothetical protein PKE08_03060, partial [Candidatus Paceibacterota bacterium]|nr:hypothetical protein [Candidatus Paceibacterota bacterium]